MSCANKNNQDAINVAIRENNRRLEEIDKASGIEDPKPQYPEGANFCHECEDAGNPDSLKDIFDSAAGRDSGFHRICYKEEMEGGEPK